MSYPTNTRAIIATNIETREVKKFKMLKDAAEFSGLNCSTRLTKIIRKIKPIHEGWEYEYKN